MTPAVSCNFVSRHFKQNMETLSSMLIPASVDKLSGPGSGHNHIVGRKSLEFLSG